MSKLARITITAADQWSAVFQAQGTDAVMGARTMEITRLRNYVQEMLAGYGGAEAVMDVLEYDKAMIGQHVLHGYFAAKAMIDTATTAEDVMLVDLAEA